MNKRQLAQNFDNVTEVELTNFDWIVSEDKIAMVTNEMKKVLVNLGDCSFSKITFAQAIELIDLAKGNCPGGHQNENHYVFYNQEVIFRVYHNMVIAS